MGKRDEESREFFSDPKRFADVINGICFEGRQLIRPENLSEVDTQGRRRAKDLVRKVAFHTEFAIIGIENQETVDYSMAVRVMDGDLDYYRRQVREVNKETRQKLKEKSPDTKDLNAGERLYAYPKAVRLSPVITIVLSNGDCWDGPRSLKDMLKLDGIPEEIKNYISNYPLHIVDVSNMTPEDTAKFKTDVKAVFDIIRCCRNQESLKDLMKKNGKAYEQVEPDAYNLMNQYINLDAYSIHPEQLKGGNVNVKTAIDQIMEEKSQMMKEKKQMKTAIDQIMEEKSQMMKEKKQMKTAIDQMSKEKSQMETAIDQMTEENGQMKKILDEMQDRIKQFEKKQEATEQEFQTVKNQLVEVEEKSIHGFIEDKIVDGIPVETIRSRLIKFQNLSAEKADAYIRKFIPENYMPFANAQ